MPIAFHYKGDPTLRCTLRQSKLSGFVAMLNFSSFRHPFHLLHLIYGSAPEYLIYILLHDFFVHTIFFARLYLLDALPFFLCRTPLPLLPSSSLFFSLLLKCRVLTLTLRSFLPMQFGGRQKSGKGGKSGMIMSRDRGRYLRPVQPKEVSEALNIKHGVAFLFSCVDSLLDFCSSLFIYIIYTRTRCAPRESRYV